MTARLGGYINGDAFRRRRAPTSTSGEESRQGDEHGFDPKDILRRDARNGLVPQQKGATAPSRTISGPSRGVAPGGTRSARGRRVAHRDGREAGETDARRGGPSLEAPGRGQAEEPATAEGRDGGRDARGS